MRLIGTPYGEHGKAFLHRVHTNLTRYNSGTTSKKENFV